MPNIVIDDPLALRKSGYYKPQLTIHEKEALAGTYAEQEKA